MSMLPSFQKGGGECFGVAQPWEDHAKKIRAKSCDPPIHIPVTGKPIYSSKPGTFKPQFLS